jgi:hypothetical protein
VAFETCSSVGVQTYSTQITGRTQYRKRAQAYFLGTDCVGFACLSHVLRLSCSRYRSPKWRKCPACAAQSTAKWPACPAQSTGVFIKTKTFFFRNCSHELTELFLRARAIQRDRTCIVLRHAAGRLYRASPEAVRTAAARAPPRLVRPEEVCACVRVLAAWHAAPPRRRGAVAPR